MGVNILENLAPIVLFVYNRPVHTLKTIESLRKNNLALESDIYIFCDAAKSQKDVENVNSVRMIVDNISGFKKKYVVAANKNKGLSKSVIEGVSEIIEKYNKVIVLEDDIVTSHVFLEFMNETLDLFKTDNQIWSISGYAPNINIPQDYLSDTYLSYRASSWGWGTWRDRWRSIDWEIKDYKDFIVDSNKLRGFNKGGNDMAPMLSDQMKKNIDSWAIRWCYNQFKHRAYTIYPCKSLVRNIGNDLSGIHSSITNKYNVELSIIKPNLDPSIKESSILIREFKEFYDLNIWGWFAITMKRLGLYKPARYLRNKLTLIKYKLNFGNRFEH